MPQPALLRLMPQPCLLPGRRHFSPSGRCAQTGPHQRGADGAGPQHLLTQHGGWVQLASRVAGPEGCCKHWAWGVHAAPRLCCLHGCMQSCQRMLPAVSIPSTRLLTCAALPAALHLPAVNFWISYCLVPREMRMYPGRLPASAWHLANNPAGRVIGFSGVWRGAWGSVCEVGKAPPVCTDCRRVGHEASHHACSKQQLHSTPTPSAQLA